jgi:hypothetical protein
VIHRGLQSERLQRAISPDAQQNFLTHAHFQISTLELGGDLAMFGPVGRQIGVQQVQLDSSDIHVPDLYFRFSVREIDGHFHVSDGLDRPGVKIVVFERFLLPSLGIEVGAEITLLIEEPDADERTAQVARCLSMAAG